MRRIPGSFLIGAIALPVLIFLIKVGWPKIREYFDKGLEELKQDVDQAKTGQ